MIIYNLHNIILNIININKNYSIHNNKYKINLHNKLLFLILYYLHMKI